MRYCDDPLGVVSSHGESLVPLPLTFAIKPSSVTIWLRNAAVTIRQMPARAKKGDPLDALGNPVRRDIVALLARKPRSVQEIADRMPISRPAVSRHLRVLNGAGLISDEQKGTKRVYRLERPYL